MKKITMCLFLFLTIGVVRADEGMWLPLLVGRLNQVDMQKMGLQLTADEIYSVNHSSLKDAIVQFGGGCTGEIVSAEGLLFTNHHCGYGQIQSHATVENDILTHGFWAKSKADELPNEGLSVKFLVKMEDVTKEVLAKTNPKMSENERKEVIEKAIKNIENREAKDNLYTALVKSFFKGNEYYLFVYEIYEDVRLVGAPPSSIGKFGYDSDNWMWPRHTGDFSVFRVYMSPDGKPAKYSPDNVPYIPKHFLPISIQGVKQGDFAMTLGYPGSTDRYLTSFGVQQLIDIKAPSIVKVRERKMGVWSEFMNADPKVQIQYASKYASLSNYWKYFLGQKEQLKKNNVKAKKEEIEKNFAIFARENKEYADVLTNLQAAYVELNKVEKASIYTQEAIFSGPEIFRFAYASRDLLTAMQENNEAEIKSEIEKLNKIAKSFYKDFSLPLNEKLTEEMFELYSTDIPVELQPQEYVKWVEKSKNNYSKMSQELHTKSLFANPKKFEAFMANPDAKELETDPAYYWVTVFMEKQKSYVDENLLVTLNKYNRLFVKGLREMNPSKAYAPDANSTMRLSYGTVSPYEPADAVFYDFKTTLKGVMQKEDSSSKDYIVAPKLKKLYEEQDYGIYSENNEIVTCFLTNNDITGGNSGSPVLNRKGELIGLAFDGNWEAMSGDINYEPALQRTIVVDIRYVLFVIDKYAGAKNLIEEIIFGSK